MPYGAARFTEAFRIFCAQFVFGRYFLHMRN